MIIVVASLRDAGSEYFLSPHCAMYDVAPIRSRHRTLLVRCYEKSHPVGVISPSYLILGGCLQFLFEGADALGGGVDVIG